MRTELLKEAQLPSIHNFSDRVTIMRADYQRFVKSYGALLYFASRVIGIKEDKVTVVSMETFEVTRFNNHNRYIENLSFPVSSYIEEINKLKKENQRLKTIVARNCLDEDVNEVRSSKNLNIDYP
jgi:hypothetical protein